MPVNASPAAPRHPGAAPSVALESLDDLWFQVAGTLCNIECAHCFISCGPSSRAFGLMTKESVVAALEASRPLGVKEYYFTGGEPFLHRDLIAILEATLAIGPATVLTNGLVLPEKTLDELVRIEAESPYSLEIRVSLDGATPAENDPIRGAGTFGKALDGIARLVSRGFLPIVTVTRPWAADDGALFDAFVSLLRAAGYGRPRIKMIPILKIGAEEGRGGGYAPDEWVTEDMMLGFDAGELLCSRSRIVTDRGVSVCPILIEKDDARLGPDLASATRPYALAHQACYSCYLWGAICSNASSGRARDGGS